MSRTGAALRATGWVTVGVVVAGGVAAAATNDGGSGGSTPAATVTTADTTTTTPANTTPAANTPAGKHPRLHRLGQLRGRVLHGQITVEGKDNQPVVVAEQRGKVDAVSTTSITLTSKDGFHQTYAVSADTRVRIDGKKSAIGDVKVGQTAGVIAKVEGSTQTARVIIERPAK